MGILGADPRPLPMAPAAPMVCLLHLPLAFSGSLSLHLCLLLFSLSLFCLLFPSLPLFFFLPMSLSLPHSLSLFPRQPFCLFPCPSVPSTLPPPVSPSLCLSPSGAPLFSLSLSPPPHKSLFVFLLSCHPNPCFPLTTHSPSRKTRGRQAPPSKESNEADMFSGRVEPRSGTQPGLVLALLPP